jgi:molybdate transport system substrate-binding protein
MNRTLARAGALALLVALSGCGGDDSGSSGGGGDDTTLNVFAAASLKGAFEEIAKDFEADHDGVTVELSFAGSSDLVSQIQGGAPADVMASADQANMRKLTTDSLVATPHDFATNTLEIAVPPGNPAGVQGLGDLTEPGLNLVVCAPEVPCGAATRQVADNAGITLKPVSEEQSVTDVLNKVETGEADAGLVYVTDVEAAGDKVEGIAFPAAEDVVNVYPIATVAGSDTGDLAQEFVDLVLGDTGQAVLRQFGFGRP